MLTKKSPLQTKWRGIFFILSKGELILPIRIILDVIRPLPQRVGGGRGKGVSPPRLQERVDYRGESEKNN